MHSSGEEEGHRGGGGRQGITRFVQLSYSLYVRSLYPSFEAFLPFKVAPRKCEDFPGTFGLVNQENSRCLEHFEGSGSVTGRVFTQGSWGGSPAGSTMSENGLASIKALRQKGASPQPPSPMLRGVSPPHPLAGHEVRIGSLPLRFPIPSCCRSAPPAAWLFYRIFRAHIL